MDTDKTDTEGKFRGELYPFLSLYRMLIVLDMNL